MASSALVLGAVPVTTASWKATSSSLKALSYEVISLMLRDFQAQLLIHGGKLGGAGAH